MTKTPIALAVAVCGLFLGATAFAQGLRVPGASARPSLSALVPPATVSAEPRQADYIVAVVNSEPITNNEVRMRVLRNQQQIAQSGQPMPSRDQLAKLSLDRMISERALVQNAREVGIKVDDSQVDAAEASIAAQNQIEVTELRRRIRQDGLDPQQLRQDLRDQLTIQRLRERDFDSRIKVSDGEIEQFVRDQRAQAANAPSELNLAQILVSVPESATPAQVAALQAKADDAARRARAGEDFGKLASALSDGAERAAGGAFGMRSADRYPELFVNAVRSLPVGAIAGPVRSGAGFHVLKVVERRQPGGVVSTIPEFHARHILLRLSPTLTPPQALQRLADFKRRIEAKEATFADLAREFSQDGSSKNGGDLGWTRPGVFVPEFEDVLERLGPGEIADPMLSRFGAHLIQLLETREVPLSPREQREIAINMLKQQKSEAEYPGWAQEIRARAYVEMREPPQ